MKLSQLEMWTVCAYPADYPEHFTARKCLIDHGVAVMTGEVTLADTLDEIRDAMESRGLVKLSRDPADDPVIVEVWL